MTTETNAYLEGADTRAIGDDLEFFYGLTMWAEHAAMQLRYTGVVIYDRDRHTGIWLSAAEVQRMRDLLNVATARGFPVTEPMVTASPAVLLREAASRMRALAQAATPGPWRAFCERYGDTSGGTAEHERRDLLWEAPDE